LYHWYVGEPLAGAITQKVAAVGAVTDWLWGLAPHGFMMVKANELEAPPPGTGFVTTTA
jgi:hypothetical protein